jgi:hypothetical protein
MVMGHERLGFLPRTKRWRTIVDDLARFSHNVVTTEYLAAAVLKRVQTRFVALSDDKGLEAAFNALVVLAYAARSRESVSALTRGDMHFTLDSSEFQVAQEISRCIERNVDSLEHAAIAKGAAQDAIAQWHQKISIGQEELFGQADQNADIWRQAGSGIGFCEISRLFFAKLTERYLLYFLEREAGAQSQSVEDSVRLRQGIEAHVDKVSRYAFETARITQSFAAGWYNKNTANGLPARRQVRAFLAHAIEKLRDEMRREAQRS